MKYNKLLRLTFVFVMTCFLLTACGNNTSYINDQRGKSIPVTASDSDTYTFKLSATEIEDTEEPPIDVMEEETPPEQEMPIATEEPTVELETLPEEEPASIGPKTGEP